MTTYNPPSDTELAVEKPILTSVNIRLRNMSVAITEGAAGAPRVLSDTAINWGGGGVGAAAADTYILATNAQAATGGVGTYAFLGETTTTTTAAGATRLGSGLRYSGIRSTGTWIATIGLVIEGGGSITAPSGTWRCMGVSSGGAQYAATIWLRIS